MDDRKFVLIPKKVRVEDFSALEPEFKVVEPADYDSEFTEAELDEILPQTAAIVAITEINAKMIAKALSLKTIVANGAGYDNIDITAANALKIPVINIPDATAQSTAELALALMLNVSRRISELDRKIRRAGSAVESLFAIGSNPGHNLFGKTLGIIGLGHIGMTLAEFCWPLRMNIQYYNRNRLPMAKEKSIRYASFDELLATSDIISIHCPVNDQSRNLFNHETFSKMKDGAILINTARGAIVDHQALMDALLSGKLGGAAIDVYPDEPRIPEGLTKFDRVVLTPHIGTNTVETRAGMAAAIMDVIRTVCLSDTAAPYRNTVNPEIYQKSSRSTPADEPVDENIEKEA